MLEKRVKMSWEMGTSARAEYKFTVHKSGAVESSPNDPSQIDPR